MGTGTVTFVFGSSTNTTLDDSGLTAYDISAKWRSPGDALTRIPYDPQLVKNYSGAGTGAAVWFHGVLDTEESKVIETWDSGIPGYRSYSLAYSSQAYTDTDQQAKSSTVEVHQYIKLDSEIISANEIWIPRLITADPDDVTYSVYTVSKINNVTSGFSYKIEDLGFVSDNIKIVSASGFPFVQDTVIEVICYVESVANDSNIRNGATVNFTERIKGIGRFCRSVWHTQTASQNDTEAVISLSNGEILGMSATETTTDLQDAICWFSLTDINGTSMLDVTASGFGTSTLTITYPSPLAFNGNIFVQILVRDTVLPHNDDVADNDGLLIGYNYIPHQTAGSLPDTLTLEAVTRPTSMYISNLGTGGGTAGEPYSNPLEHIPVNDLTIGTEGVFSNFDPFRFHNFSVDSGFVQLPIHIPGSLEDSFTLSSPSVDSLERAFYSVCSTEVMFSAEGLIQGNIRKVYYAMVARVKDPTNTEFMNGEYVMVVFCRVATTETENVCGYESSADDAIAVYRLPNKPISRV
jgi:hypothetical protein